MTTSGNKKELSRVQGRHLLEAVDPSFWFQQKVYLLVQLTETAVFFLYPRAKRSCKSIDGKKGHCDKILLGKNGRCFICGQRPEGLKRPRPIYVVPDALGAHITRNSTVYVLDRSDNEGSPFYQLQVFTVRTPDLRAWFHCENGVWKLDPTPTDGSIFVRHLIDIDAWDTHGATFATTANNLIRVQHLEGEDVFAIDEKKHGPCRRGCCWRRCIRTKRRRMAGCLTCRDIPPDSDVTTDLLYSSDRYDPRIHENRD